MLTFIAVCYNLALPYWSVLKKELFVQKFSPLTIQFSHFIGHPVGLIVLVLLGFFTIPSNPSFYLYWLFMIVLAAASVICEIQAMSKTEFFSVQVLGSLGFIFTTLAGVFVVGETLSVIQIGAVGIALLGMLLFAWPKRLKNTKFVWNRGIFLILLSLIFGALAAAFFKIASFYVPDLQTFLTGRFIGDLIIWPVIWVAYVISFYHKNPFIELKKLFSTGMGLQMGLGFALMMLLNTWLVYELPLTTVVMLGTLTIPVSYLWGRFKYKDKVTVRMWVGTMLIMLATIFFLLY